MPEEVEVSRHSALLKYLIMPVMRVIAMVLLALLGPIRVANKQRIPRTGGLLVVSNHQSDMDPIVVQWGCPRPIHFMAKSELFEMRSIRGFLDIMKAFPVRRNEADRTALRHAINLLKAGEVVCIFPEGELSESGKLQDLKEGVAFIAKMARSQVICCGLNGVRRIVPYGKLIPRPAFRSIWMKWGEARAFGKETETEEMMDWMRCELLGLSGEAEAGVRC